MNNDTPGDIPAASIMSDKGRDVWAGGFFPVMLDAGDWWMFCHSFLLLEAPIKQSMDGFLGWVTGVVSNLLLWTVGIWASVDGGVAGGSSPKVMNFACVMMSFLLICGGRDMVPQCLVGNYFASTQNPASGVWFGEGCGERLCGMFLLYMRCTCNYLHLMWMDREWVGVPMVSCLGYEEEVWPLASGSFREVWGRVFLAQSPLHFLLHSVVGALFNWVGGSYIFEDSECGT
jgi:hypothetical protein